MTGKGGLTRRASSVPAPLFLVGSGLTQYVGAAIAVGLFQVMEPASVAWWRICVAAVVLVAWRRPWRAQLRLADLGASVLFGVAITAMNVSFYEAIHRLPLGVAVSMEFLGPVAVAVARGHGAQPRIAAVLALAGVAAIGGLGLDLDKPGTITGIVWILAAAACWAAYILIGQRIAHQRSGITNLAIGCAAGALLFSPFLAPGALPAFSSWGLILAVIGVGLLSTVFPYSFEAIAMTRLTASVFALFTALLPATSTLVGAIMLRQVPSVWEFAGLVLISVAVWLASRSK